MSRAKYRHNLPQLSNSLFLTDGGLETTLIFHEGHELPYFAAFDLMTSEQGHAALRDYYRRYLAIATAHALGFVLESPTWRASADWADKLGYSAGKLADVNAESIALMAELRDEYEFEGFADGDQRLRRTARRRLRSRPRDERGGGRGLSRAADQDLQRDASRHGDRHHHDQFQRSRRRRPRGRGRGHAGRHLVHARDRRAIADRAEPGGRDRGGRCGNRIGRRPIT